MAKKCISVRKSAIIESTIFDCEAVYMKFLRFFGLFTFGGLCYGIIEICWRGYTHISMFFAGGLCFLLIDLIDEAGLFGGSILFQAPVCALCMTAVELMFGLVVNRTLRLDVWDYSDMPFNLWGQICLPFSGLWLILAVPANIAAKGIRKFLFSERVAPPKLLPELRRAENKDAVK